MPRINQKDLDVIRLTALFVAKNGRQFMTQLAQRETGNPQFQFLIPNHTLHNFFQHIVDQYTTLLRASGLEGEGGKLQEERVAELEKNVQDKFRVLERARARAEYAKHQEKRKKEEEEEEKKAEFARIDWSDFVVVETINFTDADEQANLPPPTNLSELQYASLEDRNKASIASNMRIEEAFPGEEDSMASNGYPAAQLPHGYTPSPPAQAGYQPPAPPQQVYGVQLPERSAQQDEEERRIQERVEAQARRQNAQAEARAGPGAMKIRENYVPRAAQKAAANRGQMALCPNCKQQIPMDELEDHMRSKLTPPTYLNSRNLPYAISTDLAICSRASGPQMEGTKSQGRHSLRGIQHLPRRRGEQPEAAGEPAQRRLRPGDGPGHIRGRAGAAQEGGDQ
jgi:splicing factor 3A subunit 1